MADQQADEAAARAMADAEAQVNSATAGLAGRLAGENVAGFWAALVEAGVERTAASELTHVWMAGIIGGGEAAGDCPGCPACEE
jgi:hypothetical protein